MAIIVGFPTNNNLLQGSEVADEIYGNSIGTVTFVAGSDRIFGRGGDDVIVGDGVTIAPNGTGGNDVIQGGDGDDTVYGDARGSVYGIAGNDTIYQNAGSGLLVGDGNVLETGTTGGADKLIGGGTLVGDAVADMISAKGGNDFLDASSALDGADLFGDTQGALGGTSWGGQDRLRGSVFADALFGDADDAIRNAAVGGKDIVNGNGGDDLLIGDATLLENAAKGGNDTINGGSGADLIYGDGAELSGFAKGGNDVITGNAGDDEMWGDGELIGPDASGGKDKFVFAGAFGDDTVLDFRTTDGDVLVFKGLTQSDVTLSIITVTDPNDSLLINTLGDESVTLFGFTGSLTPGVDILFN